jgi:hypothetical protein
MSCYSNINFVPWEHEDCCGFIICKLRWCVLKYLWSYNCNSILKESKEKILTITLEVSSWNLERYIAILKMLCHKCDSSQTTFEDHVEDPGAHCFTNDHDSCTGGQFMIGLYDHHRTFLHFDKYLLMMNVNDRII